MTLKERLTSILARELSTAETVELILQEIKQPRVRKERLSPTTFVNLAYIYEDRRKHALTQVRLH